MLNFDKFDQMVFTIFFDFNGIVHYKFRPYGRTGNKEYFLEVMHHFREAINRKCPNCGKTTHKNASQ